MTLQFADLPFDISIHTPAWGATAGRSHDNNIGINFNPHSHEGSDSFYDAWDYENAIFQSTLPRGERHTKIELLVYV